MALQLRYLQMKLLKEHFFFLRFYLFDREREHAQAHAHTSREGEGEAGPPPSMAASSTLWESHCI